jgi:hypothetical protein
VLEQDEGEKLAARVPRPHGSILRAIDRELDQA